MPRVSVVIPAYNVEAYLADALHSVLAQTFEDFEVLVINDGSTDRTLEVAARFADDPRVRVITQRNRGLAGARNAGIRAAVGEYVAFLDADDLWHPEKLARHVAHLAARPLVGVSYSQSAFIDESGAALGYLQAPKLHDVRASDVFRRNPVGNGSAPVIRAATLASIAYPAPAAPRRELWYFDESFRQSEDIECWMRIALTTHWRFEGIGAPLTLYRVNAGGLSANLERQFESWQRAVEKTRRYAPSFVAHWGAAARGYQLRYLARRAVRMGDGAQALSLWCRGLRSHPSMLREEPARTLLTGVAAALRACVPNTAFRRAESLGMRLATRLAGQRLAA